MQNIIYNINWLAVLLHIKNRFYKQYFLNFYTICYTYFSYEYIMFAIKLTLSHEIVKALICLLNKNCVTLPFFVLDTKTKKFYSNRRFISPKRAEYNL